MLDKRETMRILRDLHAAGDVVAGAFYYQLQEAVTPDKIQDVLAQIEGFINSFGKRSNFGPTEYKDTALDTTPLWRYE